jgi:hypothetical protein
MGKKIQNLRTYEVKEYCERCCRPFPIDRMRSGLCPACLDAYQQEKRHQQPVHQPMVHREKPL